MRLSKKLTTVTAFSKYLAIVLFIVLPFVGFYFGIKYQEIKPNIAASTERVKLPQISCAKDNRYLETTDVSDGKLLQQVNGDKKIFKFVRDNCLWIIGSLKANLTDINKENFVFWGSYVGCGSCHTQTLYLFLNSNLITKKELDEPKISIIKSESKLDKLQIVEPLRSMDEPYSSPTWGIKTIYEWQSFSNSLFPISKVPEKY